ncbi:hypothetical protein ABH931_006462 [Streptacidiphilus sp. MAP12-33]
MDCVPGEIATLVVGNDLPAGSLVVQQSLSGPGASRATGPFGSFASCSRDGKGDMVKRQIALFTTKLSLSMAGVPAGASRSVRRTAGGGADRTALPAGPVAVPASGVATVRAVTHVPVSGSSDGGVIHSSASPTPGSVDNPNGPALPHPDPSGGPLVREDEIARDQGLMNLIPVRANVQSC